VVEKGTRGGNKTPTYFKNGREKLDCRAGGQLTALFWVSTNRKKAGRPRNRKALPNGMRSLEMPRKKKRDRRMESCPSRGGSKKGNACPQTKPWKKEGKPKKTRIHRVDREQKVKVGKDVSD